MSAFVETSILVRHLTGDPPEMTERATAFPASEPEIHPVSAGFGEVGEVGEVIDVQFDERPPASLASPSAASSGFVVAGDVAVGVGGCSVVVFVGVAVVGGAFEAAVVLGGGAAGGPGHDVVHVALIRRDIAE